VSRVDESSRRLEPGGRRDCSARWKFAPRAVRSAADTFFDALGDRPEGTYRLRGQYKPDAQASACIFCVAMECTRLRVGLVLVCFHLPFALEGDSHPRNPDVSFVGSRG